MRRYRFRAKCGHEGCTEFAIYESDTRKDQARQAERYGNGKWRCVRHSQPTEVLSVENARRVTEWRIWEETHGRFWGKDGPGSGFCHGPGFKAFAEDFPAGTTIRITAEIILPDADR